MSDDAALGYVLGTLDEEERAQLESRLESDRSLAEAVARARKDVAEITTGIGLVASGAGGTRRGLPRQRPWKPIAAAAAVILLAGGGVALLRDGKTPSPEPTPPSIVVPVPGAGELDNLVRDAVAIVTGTVVDVRDGAASEGSGGIDYQIAIVELDETIKGSTGPRFAAFDYTYGSPWVANGTRVLLFLASSADTVHEQLEPPHLQVLSGDVGSYEISDGSLVGAPFTLDEVRDAARNRP
jgi:hypothetical protein